MERREKSTSKGDLFSGDLFQFSLAEIRQVSKWVTANIKMNMIFLELIDSNFMKIGCWMNCKFGMKMKEICQFHGFFLIYLEHFGHLHHLKRRRRQQWTKAAEGERGQKRLEKRPSSSPQRTLSIREWALLSPVFEGRDRHKRLCAAFVEEDSVGRRLNRSKTLKIAHRFFKLFYSQGKIDLTSFFCLSGS